MGVSATLTRCLLLQWLISQQVSFSRDPGRALSSEQLQGNPKTPSRAGVGGVECGFLISFLTAFTEFGLEGALNPI